jgi:hypothetical protein
MLAAYYHAPFDLALIGAGTITISTSGKPDVVVSLATLTGSNNDASASSSILWHYIGDNAAASGWCAAADQTGAARLVHHSRVPLHMALQTALQAEATAQAWSTPSGLTVAFRRQDTPITYRFAYSVQNITITWSTAVGRALLGFGANVSAGTQQADGDRVPTYVAVPTLEHASDDTPDFEEQEIGNHTTPDDNSGGYGVSRYTARVRRDWTQQFETKERSHRRSAESTYPWTLQHLFEYCRGEKPFAIAAGPRGTTGSDVEFFYLEQVAWKPERASPGNDAQFHIPFKCIVVGHSTVGP